MRRTFTSTILLAALLAGCEAEQPSLSSAAPGPATELQSPAARSPAAAQGELYTVDPASSEVFWTVSSAGVMARFGHNHVISARQLSGTVTVDPEDPSQSRFELDVPVAELVVDDPELRARLGEGFTSVPSEEDKAGTRRNMLGDGLLQGDTYPSIRLRGGAPERTATGSTLPVEIEIRGNTFELDLPGDVVVEEAFVEASGEFALEHADLGLTPFSALGGALQVGRTIEFAYRIRAVRAR